MRLLVCTQAVDRTDPILGFFHAWLERFAAECESVIVVCLRKGACSLPANVEVISLGDRGKFMRALELCTIAWGRRNEYDAVFVHMNPEYVLATGWMWRLLRKKVGLWYVHKSTKFVREALPLVSRVFTVSPATFPIKSGKVMVTGHGIDTDRFKASERFEHNGFRIVTVGRIGHTKNTKKIAEAVLAFAHDRNVSLDIYGEPVTEEERAYDHDLRNWLQVKDVRGAVRMKGAIVHEMVPGVLGDADVLVNMGETGGVDKAVLEAMAAGIPVISPSPAHAPLFQRYPQLGEENVSAALEYVYGLSPETRHALGGDLREEVVEQHSLAKLVPRILRELA